MRHPRVLCSSLLLLCYQTAGSRVELWWLSQHWDLTSLAGVSPLGLKQRIRCRILVLLLLLCPSLQLAHWLCCSCLTGLLRPPSRTGCSRWCFGDTTTARQVESFWWRSSLESSPVWLICRHPLRQQERGGVRCLLVGPIMAVESVGGLIWCMQTQLWGPHCYLGLLCFLYPHLSPLPRSERPHWAGRAGWAKNFVEGSGSCNGDWDKALGRSRQSGSLLSPGLVERKGIPIDGPSTGTSSCQNGAGLATAPAPLAPHMIEGGSSERSGGLWGAMSPVDGNGGSCERRCCGWRWMELRLIQWQGTICNRDHVYACSTHPGPEEEGKKTSENTASKILFWVKSHS